MNRIVSLFLIAIGIAVIPLKITNVDNSIGVGWSAAQALPRMANARKNIEAQSRRHIQINQVEKKLSKRAITVLEVVLNEMAGSGLVGRDEAFEDAVNIASVIANRARAARVTQRAVVSVRQEFNGYGIRMRPGARKDLLLAARAMEFVAENGPVHNAMFYATPPSVKYLPAGLKPVAQSPGHMFFVDPKRRSYKTTSGYIRPDPAFFSYQQSLLSLETPEWFYVRTAMRETGANDDPV